MTHKDFLDFKEEIKHQVLNILDHRKHVTEKFKLQIASLEIILNTCESVFKYLPTYDLPLHRISIGSDNIDIVEVEFEIFDYFDTFLLGAYHATITEYVNTPVGLSLEEMLLFTVGDICQYSDMSESPDIKTYSIWKLLKTEFVITKINNNKILLLTNTGQGFIDSISEGS